MSLASQSAMRAEDLETWNPSMPEGCEFIDRLNRAPRGQPAATGRCMRRFGDRKTGLGTRGREEPRRNKHR